jgi:hypothetical protein
VSHALDNSNERRSGATLFGEDVDDPKDELLCTGRTVLNKLKYLGMVGTHRADEGGDEVLQRRLGEAVHLWIRLEKPAYRAFAPSKESM